MLLLLLLPLLQLRRIQDVAAPATTVLLLAA